MAAEKRVHIHTYGCQMNKRDTEAVGSLLARYGWRVAENEATADLVIVNTCSVRGKAEDKALGKLGLLVSARRKQSRTQTIGVMGCMVQRLGDRLFDKVPGLDFAVGTRRLAAIPGIVDCVLAGQGPVLDTGENADLAEDLCGHEDGRVTAFVNVLFGCDRRCAYCIVPTVRGHEWSRPSAKIVEECRQLADGGIREVCLLGQSVTQYGKTNAVFEENEQSPGGFTEPLPRLLEVVNAIEGIQRIRFTSAHPTGCTPELVRAFKDLPSVCEHLHLPVQSGADSLLKRMRRGYDTDVYRKSIAALRHVAPGLGLTTDVIVGFPGETEEEFNATRAFMDEMLFDNAFIFKYSPRPGTPAAAFDDDVPEEVKIQRNQLLLSDQETRGQALNERLLGTQVEVLVEGVSLRNEKKWSGRTRTNKIAVFEPVSGLDVGQLRQVRIDRAMPQTIYGTLDDESFSNNNSARDSDSL